MAQAGSTPNDLNSRAALVAYLEAQDPEMVKDFLQTDKGAKGAPCKGAASMYLNPPLSPPFLQTAFYLIR